MSHFLPKLKKSSKVLATWRTSREETRDVQFLPVAPEGIGVKGPLRGSSI
jgi:hypothetical protein